MTLDLVEVSPTGLQPGDTVVGTRDLQSTGMAGCPSYDISEVTSDGTRVRLQGSTNWYPTDHLRGFVFVVRRAVAASRCATASKKIDEFPGQCTRCGRDAYVSAFSVSHRDEEAAAGCPARRG